MEEKVRAKFRVDSIEGGVIELSPVKGGSEENESFYQATPGGSIELAIVNLGAVKLFAEGKEYYVDFSRA